MLNVALLGAGRIGQVHARSIRANADGRLVAVSDLVTDAAHQLAVQHGAEARVVADILADCAIDAVLIATSTETHSDLIAPTHAAFVCPPIPLTGRTGKNALMVCAGRRHRSRRTRSESACRKHARFRPARDPEAVQLPFQSQQE
jgi:Oxidoreductase family, NAD-binding Rossmann fold